MPIGDITRSLRRSSCERLADIDRRRSACAVSAGNDFSRRFPFRFRRRRNHRQISAIACELMRGDLAIADGGQFATQELNRRTMLRRRTLEVDNADPRASLQGGRKIVEEGIG